MFIHLGQDTVVKKEDIIGIFDLDTATVSKRTRDFLSKAEKAGKSCQGEKARTGHSGRMHLYRRLLQDRTPYCKGYCCRTCSQHRKTVETSGSGRRRTASDRCRYCIVLQTGRVDRKVGRHRGKPCTCKTPRY